MLQYDNNAFAFFALSLISIYLIPSWKYIISSSRRALFATDKQIGALERTSAEKKKSNSLKKSQRGIATLNTFGYILNVVLTVAFTILFFYLIVSISEDGEVSSFDPFNILEIDSGAGVKEIKKAYKKMSLKWHPDKNPNNRQQAEAMFMMVAKAYEALTDEKAKKNWELYGNPDGKQSLEVSIGLPAFLLEASNRNLVLVSYLLIMVIFIPFCVWLYYSNSSKFGEKSVMYDSYSWFHHTLNEHTVVKALPEALSGSAEFRKPNLPKSAAERSEISTAMSKVKSQMQKPKFNHPVVIKGNVLLHSHLLRKTEELSPQCQEDLKFMLRHSNSLVDAMITVCQHQEWLQTAIKCIDFGQLISQGCWTKDSTLLQLPHFTENEVKHCDKGKGANRANNLKDYLQIADEDKKGLANMTEEQKNDVFTVCNLIPDIETEVKVFVDDDEDDKIYEGDICSVEVTLTRKNLKEGEKAPLIHAPRFPYPKQEAWWVVLGTREGKIISLEKVKDQGRVVTHKINFMAPKQGTYEFDLYVKSNAYIGLDQKHKVSLTTLDNSVLPPYKIHPDDAELDDEPTLFEEMLGANVEEDSDSDDESEDEKETGIRELSAAEKKKQELRNARKKAAGADDSDDDSDSDVEEVYTEK